MEMNAPQPRTKLRATMARRATARDLNGESLNYDAEPEPNMRLSRAIAVVLLLHIVAIGGVLAFSLIKDRAPQPLTRAKPDASGAVIAPAAVTTASSTSTPVGLKRNETPSSTLEKILSASPAAANANPSTRPPKTTTYVVRPGQTLARIASDNSVSLGALIAVNDARITTANLKPGQEIQIPTTAAPKDRVLDEATRLIETSGTPTPTKVTPAPAKSATTLTKTTPPVITVAKAIAVTPPAATLTTKPAAKAADHARKTYVVVAGDNPNKLAKKFGVSENALLKANGIEDPRKLRIGQQLVIPPKKAK